METPNAAQVYIPFNKPYLTGREIDFIVDAHKRGQLAGNGHYTRYCHQWLQDLTDAERVLLTHSCTGALEMSALLLDLKPGDEVIMPSFTFVSTANAFVLRGAIPVFVDIRPDTQNLDEELVEAAITKKTRAIVVVHYAGISCEMDTIMEIADKHKLIVIEDAAQGLMAGYRKRPLGSIGHMAAFSFHETKNVISGEGGALIINDSEFSDRAEIIWEKGTNRGPFSRGVIDRYTWLDYGSSFLPGELTAAFLAAQLQSAEDITAQRMSIWNAYHSGFASTEDRGILKRPVVPEEADHNAHIYYLILNSEQDRNRFIKNLEEQGVGSVFHYVPLDDSTAGLKFCRANGELKSTHITSSRLVRLPLWIGLEDHQERVINCVLKVLEN